MSQGTRKNIPSELGGTRRHGTLRIDNENSNNVANEGHRELVDDDVETSLSLKAKTSGSL